MFLDDLIAEDPGAVDWVNTLRSLGSGCCGVARDTCGVSGRTLRRGRYIGIEALRSGRPVPSLTALLADSSKIDMASRFRRPVLRGGWPSAGR